MTEMNEKFCDNPQCKNGLHQTHGGETAVVGPNNRRIERFEWGVGTPSPFALCGDCSQEAHNLIKSAVPNGLTKKDFIGCQSGDNFPRALAVEAHHIEALEAGTKQHIIVSGEVEVLEPIILLANIERNWSAPAIAINVNTITWKEAFDYVEEDLENDDPVSAAIVDWRERHPGVHNDNKLTLIRLGVVGGQKEE